MCFQQTNFELNQLNLVDRFFGTLNVILMFDSGIREFGGRKEGVSGFEFQNGTRYLVICCSENQDPQLVKVSCLILYGQTHLDETQATHIFPDPVIVTQNVPTS